MPVFDSDAILMATRTRVLLSVLSAAIIRLSFPPFDLYPMAWIGLIPLLAALEETHAIQTYLLGLITGMGLIIGGCYWMIDWAESAVEVSFPFSLVILVGYAFCTGQVLAVVVLIFRWLRRWVGAWDLLLLPVIWVSVVSIYPMLFPFKLADGQAGFLPAIQAIEFTGAYGLDFLIVLVNGLLYRMLSPTPNGSHRGVLGAGFLLVGLWFGYGVHVLPVWESRLAAQPVRRIGMVQPNRAVSLTRPQPEKGYSRVYPLEMEMTARLAEAGADLVIWPEGHFYGYAYWSAVREAFGHEIRRLGVPLVFYDATFSLEGDLKRNFNSSLFLNREGSLAGKYDKIKLVPLGEYTPWIDRFPSLQEYLGGYFDHLTPGRVHREFAVAGMRVIPKICYEPLFPEFIAESIGQDGKGKVLVVQTQDGWFSTTSQPYQHTAVSALRAVENRVPLIHVINNGPSTVVLPTGKYGFQSEPFARGYWLAEMPYDTSSGGSYFSEHPYLFISLVRILFLGFLVIGWQAKRPGHIQS